MIDIFFGLLLARRGTLSETTNFVMAHGLPSMSQNGVICIRVRAYFSLSLKLLSASRYLPSPLALEGLVGYLGYGGEYMEHLKHMADYINLFLFPHIFTASVITWEGRKPSRFFSTHHTQRLLSYENFTFLLDMAAILIQYLSQQGVLPA